jgi:hypothetical protein
MVQIVELEALLLLLEDCAVVLPLSTVAAEATEDDDVEAAEVVDRVVCVDLVDEEVVLVVADEVGDDEIVVDVAVAAATVSENIPEPCSLF